MARELYCNTKLLRLRCIAIGTGLVGEAVSQYKELYRDQRTVGWAGVTIQLLVL